MATQGRTWTSNLDLRILISLPYQVHTVNPLLRPPGGLFFSSTFEGGGLKCDGGGAYLIQRNASPVAKIPWYETVDLRVVQLKSLSRVFNSLVGA